MLQSVTDSYNPTVLMSAVILFCVHSYNPTVLMSAVILFCVHSYNPTVLISAVILFCVKFCIQITAVGIFRLFQVRGQEFF